MNFRKDKEKKMSFQSQKNVEQRLAWLDILRGFDMFWIIGGGTLLTAVIDYLGWSSLEPVKRNLQHTQWIGFTAWDLIFPLFIFISGAAIPFSFKKYLLSNQKKRLYLKVVRRAAVLIFLGFLYNGLLKTLDFANVRYLSVLGLIGLAYLWASIIVINFKPRGQAAVAAVILIAYYIIMSFVPVPDFGHPDLAAKDGNFASYIDRLIVPGKLIFGTSDPEGLLMSFPASVLAVAGALTGELFRNQNISHYRKFFCIFATGIICLLAGTAWGTFFPIIKKLWTSSFVVYTIGWSLLLTAVFYLVVDIWKIKKVFFPFMLIGVNPLTIYLCAHRVIDFQYTAKFFFGGLIRIAGQPLEPIMSCITVIFCEFVFLYILYRLKIFLKV